MTISLCMIVKDEEMMLPRCLESVQDIVDEMVIVDTGSTDRTVEIAENYGARVFTYPWDGSFSNARNYAITHAKMDWIFIMDADCEFETQDTDMLRSMTAKDAPATAYYGKTLSFLGDKADPANVIINLNIYLVRNGLGYRFTGDIHEQISCGDPAVKTVTAISDMRVYHYGYLNSAIRSLSKRERNMELIRKELEKNPDNPLMLYNLGNEFFTQLKIREAYDNYLKSYALIDPSVTCCPKLILRLISCCELLGKTSDQLKLIEEGLTRYPDFTDLEFIRGILWLQKERYLAAIRSFQKCLKMGDPPLLIANIPGVGTHKAAHMLFQIHHNLGDPQGALRYARIALRFQPTNAEVLSRLAGLLLESLPPEAVAKKLIRYLPRGSDKYLLLSDVFYGHRRWETALQFARKAAKRSGNAETSAYYQGVCLFYLKRYNEACIIFDQLAGSKYENRASFLGSLCALFDADAVITLPRGENEYFCVLERFEALMADNNPSPLAADAASSKLYIAPIMGLLDILLKTEHVEEFDKARRLLNLVTDDTVLMQLGKLYFRNGFLKPAYRELERSIKLVGKTDSEALRMMKYILDSKVFV